MSAIEQIKIERASFVIGKACAIDNRVAEVASLETSPERNGALRAVMRGKLQDQSWKVELHGSVLALLSDGSRPAAFQLNGEFAGARLSANGTATIKPLGVFAGCEYYNPTVNRVTWSPYFPGSVGSSSPVTAYVITDPEMTFIASSKYGRACSIACCWVSAMKNR